MRKVSSMATTEQKSTLKGCKQTQRKGKGKASCNFLTKEFPSGQQFPLTNKNICRERTNLSRQDSARTGAGIFFSCDRNSKSRLRVLSKNKMLHNMTGIPGENNRSLGAKLVCGRTKKTSILLRGTFSFSEA